MLYPMRRSWWAVPTLRASCSRKKTLGIAADPCYNISSRFPISFRPGFIMFQASGEFWVRGLLQWRGAMGLSRLGVSAKAPLATPECPELCGGEYTTYVPTFSA